MPVSEARKILEDVEAEAVLPQELLAKEAVCARSQGDTATAGVSKLVHLNQTVQVQDMWHSAGGGSSPSLCNFDSSLLSSFSSVAAVHVQVRVAEQEGIVFIDEIDKIVNP
jgi:hypothetical protein